jgi:hypothetical protein
MTGTTHVVREGRGWSGGRRAERLSGSERGAPRATLARPHNER